MVEQMKKKLSKSSLQSDVKNSAILDLEKLGDIGANLIDEVGGAALDSFLKMETLKKFPYIGTGINAVRGFFSLRDYFFARKVLEFLRSAPKISLDARQKFKAKMDADPKFAKCMASHLTVILDRMDDIEKLSLLSRLLAALVLEKIDQEQHRRLSTALERVLLSDLLALRQFLLNDGLLTMATFEGLEAAGLVFVQHSIIRPPDPAVKYGQIGSLHFGVNAVARMLVEIAFEQQANYDGKFATD